MQQIKAKKSLGQHFLTDKNIAGKIVSSLQSPINQTILEIGPGTGALTQFLVKIPNDFFAIEIDPESIQYLKEIFPERNFIIEGDFLKINLIQFKLPISIIGNFPYYISSQIFFRVLDFKDSIHEVVCMVQKEVAERIASPPGNKTYGILSVLLQSFFHIEYLFTVHEHCFSPPPKVKSAVIRLTRNERKELPCDFNQFRQVIKQAFNQRRKTLRNSLRSICLTLDTSPEIFDKRPEQLSVEEFIGLTMHIEKCKTKTG
jgi:16S rRNA (adenine1518-N6/adenine1519-N6)-dimethyltransferase